MAATPGFKKIQFPTGDDGIEDRTRASPESPAWTRLLALIFEQGPDTRPANLAVVDLEGGAEMLVPHVVGVGVNRDGFHTIERVTQDEIQVGDPGSGGPAAAYIRVHNPEIPSRTVRERFILAGIAVLDPEEHKRRVEAARAIYDRREGPPKPATSFFDPTA